MKFGPRPVEEAEGLILGHNVSGPDGRRRLRKGRPLSAADVATLKALGRATVYVAELADDDVDENAAAARLAAAVAGAGLHLRGPSTGRTNLTAETTGLLRVDVARLTALNGLPGVTLATLRNHAAVAAGQLAATLKILPYALPAAVVQQAEQVARTPAPLLRLDPLPARRAGLILSGAPAARQRIVAGFKKGLDGRLSALGSRLERVDFVPLDDEAGEVALATRLAEQVAAGLDIIILAGETAIMDRHDVAPRAVERAGGEVTCYGAPVDPGNLLMLAYLGDIPILGAPGCARSPKKNIVDLVIPRLLAGDRLGNADIVVLGHGGLLEEVRERPLPRAAVEAPAAEE